MPTLQGKKIKRSCNMMVWEVGSMAQGRNVSVGLAAFG